MTRFKDIKEVWNAIRLGKTVYWHNKSYTLTVEKARVYHDRYSIEGDRCLRVTHTTYFGSLVVPSDIKDLYTEN